MAPGTGATYSTPSDRYWADCAPEDLANVILDRATKYRDRLRKEGRLELWRRAERTYYGQDANGGMANSAAVTFGGEQGEIVMIRVNHYASIVKGLLALAVSKRPSYEPRATNTDAESAQAVTLCRSLLEAYARILSLEAVRLETARAAVLFGEAYSVLRWNTWIGKPQGLVDPDGNPADPSINFEGARIVREGDLEAQTMTPLEVVHDLDSTGREWKYAILAYRENAWDLAARYPQAREEILGMRGGSSRRWSRSAWADSPWETATVENDPDIVTVWWLYHLPTDALPNGRKAIVCGTVVLEDGTMDLDTIPVQPLYPEREVSLARGWTGMNDLLALQEAYDSAFDSILTQIDAHALPNVMMAKGTDISPEQLSGGMRVIEFEPNPEAPNAGAPSVLNLLDLSPTLIASLQLCKQQMETLSGVNQIARGDIEGLPKLSGAAYALLQSQAVAFNTALQSAVVQHDEGLATKEIDLLKHYATNERQVEIVGKAQKGALATWSADKLSSIERVVVESANPLQEQTSGRLEIATQLLQAKLPGFQAEQFIEVLTTGRLEPIYRGAKAELDLIARENEDLAAGTPCRVELTDDHALHVSEHKAVLAQVGVRGNEQLAEITRQHILAHSNMWHQIGPDLSALTKQSIPGPPIVPQMPATPPAGPHGAPKPGLPSPPPNPNRAQPLGHAPPTAGPMMPVNPINGQHAPNPGAT